MPLEGHVDVTIWPHVYLDSSSWQPSHNLQVYVFVNACVYASTSERHYVFAHVDEI